MPIGETPILKYFQKSLIYPAPRFLEWLFQDDSIKLSRLADRILAPFSVFIQAYLQAVRL